MKVMIVSDTHSYLNNFKLALAEQQPIDMLIHLGDVEGQEDIVREMAGCPVHIIAGNNDFYSSLEDEEEFQLGKYQVMITHGDRYYVGWDEDRVRNVAGLRGADIVMYGHSHRPSFRDEDGLISLNPGSLTFPRQLGRHPSYMVMTIDEAGEATFETFFL